MARDNNSYREPIREADARGTCRNARRGGYRAGSGGSTTITAAAFTRAWAVPGGSPPGAGRGGVMDVRSRVAGASPGAGEQRRAGLCRAGGRGARARPRAGLHHRQRLRGLHAERHRAALRQCAAGACADGHRALRHAHRPGRGHPVGAGRGGRGHGDVPCAREHDAQRRHGLLRAGRRRRAGAACADVGARGRGRGLGLAHPRHPSLPIRPFHRELRQRRCGARHDGQRRKQGRPTPSPRRRSRSRQQRTPR